jgi:hypothetical protein
VRNVIYLLACISHVAKVHKNNIKLFSVSIEGSNGKHAHERFGGKKLLKMWANSLFISSPTVFQIRSEKKNSPDAAYKKKVENFLEGL